MPEMDGYTATKHIRSMEKGKDVPIIAMTANAFAEDRMKCLECGMDDFISKPLLKNKLMNKIEEWLYKDNKELNEKIPMDLQGFIENMDGNKDIAIKIVTGFINGLDEQIKRINIGIQEENLTNVQREAHSIKGGALNLMANGLMNASKNLETLAKSGSLKNALKLLDEIKSEHVNLKEYIDNNLK